MAKTIKGTRESISRKIRLLRREGRPRDQAIAIAFSMAGKSRKGRRRTSRRSK